MKLNYLKRRLQMARKEQNNVDYFPFLCKEGKAMFFIENKYGNDGYATWIKILRQLAVTNYHYLNLSEYSELMYLSAKCRISEELLINIINDLCTLGEFDRDLWMHNRIIYSQKFVDNIEDAYSRRKNKIINMHTLCEHLNASGVQTAYNNSINVSKTEQTANINTQSKVKNSKVKNSKVKEIDFDTLSNEILNSEVWIQNIAQHQKLDITFVKEKLEFFIQDIKLKDDWHKGIKEVKAHFINWIKFQKEKNSAKKEKENETNRFTGTIHAINSLLRK